MYKICEHNYFVYITNGRNTFSWCVMFTMCIPYSLLIGLHTLELLVCVFFNFVHLSLHCACMSHQCRVRTYESQVFSTICIRVLRNLQTILCEMFNMAKYHLSKLLGLLMTLARCSDLQYVLVSILVALIPLA